MEKVLEGKTALVTGSGRNIGRAIVLEFASLGADVIVNARSNADEAESVAAEARALGVAALVVLGDISKQDTIDLIKDRAEERFGRVDISVSNAAIRPYQSFFDMTVEDWSNQLDVQLNASFRLAKAFVPGMVERSWGRIIHITGPDAFLGMRNRAHNVAAKGGLRGLTKALARELGPHGITVNDVAPTGIQTIKNELSHPILTTKPAAADSHHPSQFNDKTDRIAEIPVRRLGTPEDMAFACGFLASPRAGYYTGMLMNCSGGSWMAP